MRKWRFLIAAILGCLTVQRPGLEARVLRVAAGTDSIHKAVLSAVSGDTLMLTGRAYHETKSLNLPGVPLTFMADPALSAPPTWTVDDSRFLRVFHDLVVKGIRFEGQNRLKDAIRNYAVRPNKVVIEGCEIAYFTQDGVTDNDFPVDTCIVRNTVFHDIGKDAIAFRSPPDMCRNLVVENCTFYRVGDRAVYVSQKAVPVRVRITNITVHDCFGGVRLDGAIDAVVSNSILTGCRGYAVRSAPPLTLTGICTFQNTKDYELSPGGEGCFNADPRYFDAEAGDFSLLPDSPCLKASGSGGPLGDPRWAGAAALRAGRRRAGRVWGRAAGVLLLSVGLVYGVFLYTRKRVREHERQKAQEALLGAIEEALRESQEQYRDLFENALVGIYRTTPDGRILVANPTLIRMLGYSSFDEMASRNLELEGFGATDMRERFKKLLEQDGEVRGLETAWTRRDNTVIFVRENAKVVRGLDGAVLYYEGTVEDITERKRAEEALRESNRRLEEAMAELRAAQQQVVQQERLRALGQMASGIAHDFNNALSPILGFSELLLMAPKGLDDKEKVTHYLKTINTAAQDAANIVSRLREFYRHREKGEFFQPVRLNRVVEQSISLTQPRWKDQAQANGVTVEVRADLQDVPLIAGNEAELREVLTNLIFNAVDAMPEGGAIILRTRLNGEYIDLGVSDTGVGMTEEVRRRCLEPFFSTKGDRGTGLGLAMVFGTVQRHEGEIGIETEPGRGTTFTIRLPVMRERGGGEGGQQTEGLSRPLRVLVVDDDPAVRELVIAYLASDGHTVDTATSGREGLEKFRAGHYDLVITDRAMPEMGGDQMAAAVKRLAPQKPVIMLTGFGDMMQAADENPAGVDVVISKPVTRSKLREALAKVQ